MNVNLERGKMVNIISSQLGNNMLKLKGDIIL